MFDESSAVTSGSRTERLSAFLNSPRHMSTKIYVSLGSIMEALAFFYYYYSKTCLKRNAIVPVFFSVFTGFRFTEGCVLIKQSTKNMIA